MTVGELVELLKLYDEDTPVYGEDTAFKLLKVSGVKEIQRGLIINTVFHESMKVSSSQFIENLSKKGEKDGTTNTKV